MDLNFHVVFGIKLLCGSLGIAKTLSDLEICDRLLSSAKQLTLGFHLEAHISREKKEKIDFANTDTKPWNVFI